MIIQNQKIKYLIINYPYVLLLIFSFLYLLPSLNLYFIPNDINFAVFNHNYGFFENLKNIWLLPNDILNNGHSFRPIIDSIILAEYSTWGLNPFWFHLTNTALHIINIILIYKFSFSLMKRQALSFICAVIFTIHPIIANFTFWNYGKADLVACSFYLLSLIILLQYLEKKYLSSLILSQILFLLALLSKEASITLPFLQYLLVIWKRDEPLNTNDTIYFLLKIFSGNLLIVLIYSSFLVFITNQNPFSFNNIYNYGEFFQFLMNLTNSVLFIFFPFINGWLITLFFQYKFYLIVIMTPVFIKALVFIFSNKMRYYKYIMLFILFFITAFNNVANYQLKDAFYLPAGFFAILVGSIIYDYYKKSKIILTGIIFYLSSLLIISVFNYHVADYNAQISKVLVSGLGKEMKANQNFDTYMILNFPYEINQAPIITTKLESFINQKTNFNKKIITPIHVAHNKDLKPTAINYFEESFILNACEESSYFMLDKKSVFPGEVLEVEDGMITIQKVNQNGQAIRIIFKLKNDSPEPNIRYLYFDENTLQYEVFPFKSSYN